MLCFQKHVITGEAQITLTNAQGVQIPLRITNNKDQTYRVEFETTVAGTYTANVTFASVQVPGSPFTVNVVPAESDLNSVQVQELPQSMLTRITLFYFHVVVDSRLTMHG